MNKKFGHTISCIPHPSLFSKDLARKFAELGLSCKLPLEKKKKKSLEDAPNCDIMPLSQNNTEWSSYLALTSWIRVFSFIDSYCRKQVMSDNDRKKLSYFDSSQHEQNFSFYRVLYLKAGNQHVLWNCILYY